MQNFSHKQQLKDRILITASEMFTREGIRQVKMDDIAHSLGISKRTLYETYDNKEQLLMDVVKYKNEEHVKEMEKFAESGRNTIEILAEFYALQMKKVSGVNPNFLEDLHGYGNVQNFMRQERENHMKEYRQFIDKAISEGYFMQDLNYDIIDDMLTSINDNIITSANIKKYGKPALFHTVIMVFLRGVCTPKGIEQLDALMKNIDKQE